jgi:hypothetical protein
MNVLQSLKSLSNYPIPSETIQNVSEGVGLDFNAVLTVELRQDNKFKWAQAHIYFFLSEAPNVSQAGISYSFSDEERERFKLKAESIIDEIGDDGSSIGVSFGYKGADL